MILFLAACTPNTATPIDGTAFPVAAAFLEIAPGTFGDSDLLVATLSSLPDACGAQAAFRAAADGADADGLATAWAAAYPAQFTEIVLGVRVPGATWPPPGATWPGLAWDAFPEEDGVVFGSWVVHHAHRDAAWFAGEEGSEAVETTFLSDGGLAKWKRGLPSRRLVGRFTSNVTDGDGDPRGTSDLRFDAEVCP